LPATLKRALADSFDLDNYADLPQRLPDDLPDEATLRAGIAALEASLQPADETVCGRILVSLRVTKRSYEKLPDGAAEIRAKAWWVTNGDLPSDLWNDALAATLRSSTKGFPEPGEFRAHVEPELDLRRRPLKRARLMLDKVIADKERPKPPEREPRDVILKTLIRGARARGDDHKAAGYERELAAIENRPVEHWARAPGPLNPKPAVARDTTVLPPLSTGMQAALRGALARKHRAQGNGKYADTLEREARALGPSNVVAQAGTPAAAASEDCEASADGQGTQHEVRQTAGQARGR
jgi:hypothetical protein